MQVLAQLPQHELHAFAYGLERREDAASTTHVAPKPSLRNLEDIEPGDISDGILDRRRIEPTLRKKKRELFDFLLRGEEVALGGVGEELQGLGGRALPLPRKPRRDPSRQLVSLQRIYGDGDARALQRGKPT